MSKQSGIYKIQSNIKPERIYIGSAIHIPDRWAEHLRDLKKNKHHSKKLQYHYNKYGEVDLQFSVLLGCDKEDLIKTEQYFIDSYNPHFNMCKIAGNLMGVMHTPESRKRGADKRRGQLWTEEMKEKARMSAKRKGSIPWNKGKTNVYSKETKASISNSLRGNTNKRGAKLGEESLQKMRIASTGRHPSPEAIEKIRIAATGRKHRPESIEKIRNRPISAETHQRRKEGALKMWELRRLKSKITAQELSLCN